MTLNDIRICQFWYFWYAWSANECMCWLKGRDFESLQGAALKNKKPTDASHGETKQ